MKKLLFIFALMNSLVCSAQIDLYNNCPRITWRETVDDVRKIFPYSSLDETEKPGKDIYSALNIENVTLCGIALKGRAVFDAKTHHLVRLIFNPTFSNDCVEETNMTFGYFRGLLFARLGPPKILKQESRGVTYSGKYEWKRDNTYVSIDITNFTNANYSSMFLDIDSEDWESMYAAFKLEESKKQ